MENDGIFSRKERLNIIILKCVNKNLKIIDKKKFALKNNKENFNPQYLHLVRPQTSHLSNILAAAITAETKLDTRTRPTTMYRPRMTYSSVWIPDEGSWPFTGTISPNPIVLNAER